MKQIIVDEKETKACRQVFFSTNEVLTDVHRFYFQKRKDKYYVLEVYIFI